MTIGEIDTLIQDICDGYTHLPGPTEEHWREQVFERFLETVPDAPDYVKDTGLWMITQYYPLCREVFNITEVDLILMYITRKNKIEKYDRESKNRWLPENLLSYYYSALYQNGNPLSDTAVMLNDIVRACNAHATDLIITHFEKNPIREQIPDLKKLIKLYDYDLGRILDLFARTPEIVELLRNDVFNFITTKLQQGVKNEN